MTKTPKRHKHIHEQYLMINLTFILETAQESTAVVRTISLISLLRSVIMSSDHYS